MLQSGKTMRHALVVIMGTGATAGALLFSVASPASAEPPPPAPPGCSAGLPNEELRADVQTYMDAHPQTESEITGIRQPLTDLRTRCDAPAPVRAGG